MQRIELPFVGPVNTEDIEQALVKQHETGRKGVFIQTLGCQMNEHDSEIILGMLQSVGYTAVETPLAASLIVYNTCAVRENPERKLFGQIRMLRPLKQINPGLIIAICGCMTQQAWELERIQRELEHVDLIFGTHNLHRLPELLRRAECGERVVEVWSEEGPVLEGLPALRHSKLKAYITIMYGCNQFCTYCIVPHVRGRERSRRPDAILEEARELASNGCREILLLGQNVNAYGRDLGSDASFASLLRQLNVVSGLERIRFTSPHPAYMSDDVITAMAESERVCEHIHLPVQAGSDRTLRRMGRRYTRSQYLDLVARLRAAIPGLAVTTDLIVGFPGETEQDFADSLSLVKEAVFDSSFMFIFSPRRGTAAARLEDQVPEDVKRDRIHRLIEVQNEVSLRKNHTLLDQECEVLVDSVGKAEGTLAGRTRGNKLVVFPGDSSTLGELVRVHIESAHTFDLRGSVVASLGNGTGNSRPLGEQPAGRS